MSSLFLSKRAATLPSPVAQREHMPQHPSDGSTDGVHVRSIQKDQMIRTIARLHCEVFPTYLNTRLGLPYMMVFLEWFLTADRAIALVAVGADSSRPLGYLVAAPTGYARTLHRHLLPVIVKQVLRTPSLWLMGRFWKKVKAKLTTLMMRPPTRSGPVLPQPTMSLVAIGVAPSARMRGVGLALMRVFERHASESGMRSSLLSVYEDNIAARRFYERLGWQAYGEDTGKGELTYYRLLEQRPPDG